MLDYWKFLLVPQQVPASATNRTVVIEDALLSLRLEGTRGRRVKDPLAGDGSAIELFNTHYKWSVAFNMWSLGYDAGKRYRLRMRVRVDCDREQDVEAFWSGVYDNGTRRGCGSCYRKANKVDWLRQHQVVAHMGVVAYLERGGGECGKRELSQGFHYLIFIKMTKRSGVKKDCTSTKRISTWALLQRIFLRQ